MNKKFYLARDNLEKKNIYLTLDSISDGVYITGKYCTFFTGEVLKDPEKREEGVKKLEKFFTEIADSLREELK